MTAGISCNTLLLKILNSTKGGSKGETNGFDEL